MNNIYFIYLKSECKKNWLRIVRQAIYLIPIIAISLLFSTAQNMKYINQRNFLNHGNYSSIYKTNENTYLENCFKIYNAQLVTIQEHRGALVFKTSYDCEIYSTINKQYNFENSYFSKLNMNGLNPINLKSNEIIISYDAARKLKVAINDPVFFKSDVNEKVIEFIVKGIMDTKYAYQNIGSIGTAIINNQNELELLNSMYPNHYFATFSFDEKGKNSDSISLQEEKDETNFLALPMRSVIVVNVVFPVFAFLLIFILLYRENKHIFMRKKKHIAILISLGCQKKMLLHIISSIQLMVIALASLLAMILYKYGLMEGYVGEKVSLIYLMEIFLVCLVVGYISIKINVKLLRKDLEEMDVAKLLSEREDTL